MNEIVNVFKALSDPTRLRILLLLQNNEICVCEVEKVLGMKQSRISRHLNILKNAGLVESLYIGHWVFYSLPEQKANTYHRQVIDTLIKWTQDSKQVLLDQKNLELCIQNRGNKGYCSVTDIGEKTTH